MLFKFKQLCLQGLGGGVSKTPNVRPGFTLLEIMVVVAISAILATVCAVSWRVFWTNYALSTAQNEVYLIIRGVREMARRNNQTWQVGFRMTTSQEVQWASYLAGSDATQAHWQTLNSSVRLSSNTTLDQSNDIYKVAFNHKGHVNGQLGKLVLTSRSDTRQIRCVVVSTLLGGMRKGDDSSQCAPSN